MHLKYYCVYRNYLKIFFIFSISFLKGCCEGFCVEDVLRGDLDCVLIVGVRDLVGVTDLVGFGEVLLLRNCV